MWVHWVKFNIPPTVTFIPEGTEPPGVSGKGTAGNLEYYGPCPPDGPHRYFFKLYALAVELDLPTGATREEVKSAMANHLIAQAELMGTYEESKF